MTHTEPLDVLIVEDEALLAMDLQAMIEDCGHAVIGEAMCLSDVHALLDGPAPDIAFVDIQLAEGSSGLEVCRVIRERWPDTAVIFVTANPAILPSDLLGAYGVIPKPFSRHGLSSALRFICEGLTDPPPKSGQPGSFSPSPKIATAWAV